MEPQPVKCLCCDTWNLPEAKFCKNCGEDLEYHRKIAEVERELEVREKFLAHLDELQEEQERKQQESNGGCASVILLFVTLSGLGILLL